jgi:hypothetical protein
MNGHNCNKSLEVAIDKVIATEADENSDISSVYGEEVDDSMCQATVNALLEQSWRRGKFWANIGDMPIPNTLNITSPSGRQSSNKRAKLKHDGDFLEKSSKGLEDLVNVPVISMLVALAGNGEYEHLSQCRVNDLEPCVTVKGHVLELHYTDMAGQDRTDDFMCDHVSIIHYYRGPALVFEFEEEPMLLPFLARLAKDNLTFEKSTLVLWMDHEHLVALCYQLGKVPDWRFHMHPIECFEIHTGFSLTDMASELAKLEQVCQFPKANRFIPDTIYPLSHAQYLSDDHELDNGVLASLIQIDNVREQLTGNFFYNPHLFTSLGDNPKNHNDYTQVANMFPLPGKTL